METKKMPEEYRFLVKYKRHLENCIDGTENKLEAMEHKLKLSPREAMELREEVWASLKEGNNSYPNG